MTENGKKAAKFGCSQFEYGVVGADDFVTETRKMPGLTSVKIDLKNELKTLAADDGPYLVLSGGITEATQSLELYDIDSKMKQDLYGIEVKKGTEIFTKNLTPNYIATLFRTKTSDNKYIWVGMLKGMFSLPGVDTKTVDGTPDPNADSIEGNFIPRGDADTGQVVLIGREDDESFEFASFHKAVFPTSAEDAGALSK